MATLSKNLKNKYLLILTIAFLPLFAKGQVIKPSYLKIDAPDSVKVLLLTSLDTLFKNIATEKTPLNIISGNAGKLTASILSSLKGLETNEKSKQPDFYKKQLVNCYPLGNNNFAISVAYIGNDSILKLKAIITLNAHISNNQVTYSLPLQYLTADWKIKRTGNITYHYTGRFNASIAAAFNRKNSGIAKKLSL